MNARPDNPAWRRSAFTLMELMVSVAILLAILTLIGTIFATTSKAGGKATSMSTLHRQLSQVAEIIRRDLENVAPGEGGTPMGIAGKTIPAHETRQDLTLRKPAKVQRADILMLFTTAGQDPYVYDTLDPTYPTLSPLTQVVYGHADFAKFGPAGSLDLDNTLSRVEESLANQRPAAEWHLARRVIHFLDDDPPTPSPPSDVPASTANPTAAEFLTGFCEVGWYKAELVKSEFPNPGLMQFRPGSSNLAIPPPPGGDPYPVPTRFNEYLLYANKLFGLGTDGRWWVPASTASGWARWEYEPVGGTTPRIDIGMPSVPNNPPMPFDTTLRRAMLYDYAVGASVPNRSVIDPKPPLGVEHPMPWHFLGGCSEFKVEYTYDNPRELTMEGAAIDLTPRPVRWYSVPDGGAVIWSNIGTSPTDPATGDPGLTDPCRWPRAVRITLKAWDPAGRLDEPVTRTIVHTF